MKSKAAHTGTEGKIKLKLMKENVDFTLLVEDYLVKN